MPISPRNLSTHFWDTCMLQLGAEFTPLAKPMPGDTSFQEHARIQGHPVKCQNTVLCFVQNARPTCVFPHKPDLSARIPSSKETPFCKDFFSYPLHHEFQSCSIRFCKHVSAPCNAAFLFAHMLWPCPACVSQILQVHNFKARNLKLAICLPWCSPCCLAHSDLTILPISSNRT